MKKPGDRKTETTYSKDRKLRHKFRVQKNCLFTFGCRRIVRKKLERRAGNEQKDYLEARKQGGLQLKGGEKLAERST